MEDYKIKVYVQVDSNNVITKIESSISANVIDFTTGWIQIDEGTGDKYSHAQGNYFPREKPLMDSNSKYNYKLVAGKVVELTDEEKVDLDSIKQIKINEISSICEYKIINEFYSSCLGEKKKFDCTLTDQTNIIGLVAKAQMILSNATTDTSLDWKASGEPICYAWTPMQIMTLGMDLFSHKTEKIKRFEELRVYINSLTVKNEVNSVIWNTIIPTI